MIMRRIIDKIIHYYVSEEIVAQEHIPWLQYGLERKISTIIVGIPFFVLALLATDFLTAISFFATYFLIKKYLGGYHAKTIWGCLVLSLFLELLFLVVLSHYLFIPFSFIILILCTLTILILAPYNHPNLHLTSEEIKGCQKKVRLRLCFILIVAAISHLVGIREITKGCTISIAMATALLCLGYINDWRNNLWKEILLKRSQKRPPKA